MKISVFGLGYVGTVSAACLARDGHRVVGVDPNGTKVDLINSGQSPIIEAQVGDLISAAVSNGLLRAVGNAADAISDSELSLVCVGTPSASNGSLDLQYVESVCREIGAELARKDDWHTVVIRSTIIPGTMHGLVIPVLEKSSGKKAGVDFGVCNNPEFLREGTAVRDYDQPPKTVIGSMDDKTAAIVSGLYEHLDAPLIATAIEVAELVKYVDNVWHALKVAFANEIGALCKPLDIDSHSVMDIFCQDTKLNLSRSYLRPGFAFGGSCLPKDVRALNYEASRRDVALPIIGSIMESNRIHIERSLDMVMATGAKKIGVLGFSFKAGTDDLRESPIVEIIERLIGKGYDIRLYDQNVQLAKLVGANREYLLNRIPHISGLMVDSTEEILEHAEAIVIGNGDPQFAKVIQTRHPDQVVIDLVRIIGERSDSGYQGIAW